jgi:hypothetical protein
VIVFVFQNFGRSLGGVRAFLCIMMVAIGTESSPAIRAMWRCKLYSIIVRVAH